MIFPEFPLNIRCNGIKQKGVTVTALYKYQHHKGISLLLVFKLFPICLLGVFVPLLSKRMCEDMNQTLLGFPTELCR